MGIARRTACRRRACSSSFATTPAPSSPAHAVDLRSIGWTSGNGDRDVRFEIGALPLADGPLPPASRPDRRGGEHVYHWLDDALVFVVYPGDDVRGVVRFEGTWMLEENHRSAMSARTCPDWPQLMELDPDLQFKHYTVAEAQLPADALSRMSHVSLDEVEICCDLDHHVFNPGHTDPDVAEALRGTHWFDVHEWATSGPGANGVTLLERRVTLRCVPTVVIPYRGDAKRRLPSSLRAAVALAMLGDVVEAALPIGRVIVVTDDAQCVPPGAEVVPDPGAGLGAAVAAGLARRRRPRARRQRRPACRDTRSARGARRRRPRARRSDGRHDERALVCPTRRRLRARSTALGARTASARTHRSRQSSIPELEQTSTRSPTSSASHRCRPTHSRASRRAGVKIVLLSGGVGGARFARGLPDVLAAAASSRSSATSATTSRCSGCTSRPTSTAILYTLAGLADDERGWGRADETLERSSRL